MHTTLTWPRSDVIVPDINADSTSELTHVQTPAEDSDELFEVELLKVKGYFTGRGAHAKTSIISSSVRAHLPSTHYTQYSARCT